MYARTTAYIVLRKLASTGICNEILTMKSGEQSVVKIEGISDEVITLNCGLI